MSEKHLRAFVDRIEAGSAVVLVGEQGWEVAWPLEELPDGVREGDALTIRVRIDDEATDSSKRKIDSLIDRLRRGD